MSILVCPSPLGNVRLEESQGAIVAISFTEMAELEDKNPVLLAAADELKEYFAGERQQFSFPMRPDGSDFQKKVWQELQNLSYGETISYQELANRLGDPKCIRAAAAANGKNPIAIAIPCHRVIGSDGSMTGYAGGLERKKALLRLEGADVMKQIDLFQ